MGRCCSSDCVVYEDRAEIILRDRRQEEKARAIIDLEDLEKVRFTRWCVSNGYVAHGSGGPGHVKLHRLLLAAPDGLEVDHIDGDPLNNRKSNLRLVSQAKNQQNKVYKNRPASMRGIHRRKGGTWYVQVTFQGRVYSGGSHLTQEAAALAASLLRRRLLPHSVEERHLKCR